MDARSREWLVTNGLGGYALGTVAGVPTRGYHAPLVAAFPAPRGREIALQQLDELAVLGRHQVPLSCFEDERGLAAQPDALESFALELGLPVWTWRVGTSRVVKRLCMVHGENTTVIAYENAGRAPLELRLKPWMHVRGHNEPLDRPGALLQWRARDDTLEIARAGSEPLAIRALGGRAGKQPRAVRTLLRRVEAARGYGERGPVESAGALVLAVGAGETAFVVISTEVGSVQRHGGRSFELERTRRRRLLERTPGVKEPTVAELVLAADAFLTRSLRGDGAPTIIAGYPWFTDWGRDTFIALEGLTLCTGRPELARELLRGFAAHLRDGLVPNLFPEGAGEGLYNTADATLWFVHALGRYHARTQDRALVDELLPRVEEIIARHVEGTRHGIGVDHSDGLLGQGEPGLQLTWMDAKAGDWVVTPRRGKAVELNALWYQVLRLAAAWRQDAQLDREADAVQRSFNERFWCEERGHLFDVVDGEQGDDASLRPNQLLAISLPHPVLARERWRPVLERVRASLLTPMGLRTLAPEDPRYRGVHGGDVLARDGAYHMGTAWPYLIGAWIDARLALEPDAKSQARRELAGLVASLRSGCEGQVAEIASGDAPHEAEGAPAQAWSVAELLRALERCG